MSAPAVDAGSDQKRDWRRAFTAISGLIQDSERTDLVFDILDALDGQTGELGYQEFIANPKGKRLLAERPDLLGALSDRDALAGLPDRSFGRAYLAFMQEAGLSAQGLVEAELDREDASQSLDPDRRWLSDRGRDSHHRRYRRGRRERARPAL